MGCRQPMSDETMVLSKSEDTHIGNVVSETDNSVDEGKAVAWITWINDISVFLSKNDSSVAIGNIVQNDRGIGIQRLRSLDRYTPNIATRNVRRETLPRTATAKMAVERLRQEAEEPSTSTALIRTEVVKKESDVNCV
ncbi:hypothetical protein T05_7318 [Trichinella murrelli]|uniref:Uncharacterized protein n=1 Tax=Trichinella murrelli TaxID=144512 RepID=A0A0V0T0Y1_9BILA|nr:hypothetical protein T05_7318 [Trichinella murrelli]